jgi:hypothetical protein
MPTTSATLQAPSPDQGPPDVTRRRLIAAPLLRALPSTALVPWLGGCATPLPLSGAARPVSAAAQRRLLDSAEAHGLADYRRIADINIGYDGQWRPLIDRIQPEVVDAGYRGASQERLLPQAGVNAQRYRGPRGVKQVFWRRGSAADPAGELLLRYDGALSDRADLRTAAALVAEAYPMFLLGPLWLVERAVPVGIDGTERVHGRLCDVVQLWLQPGFGQVRTDRVAALIDRDDHVTRRLRFTLEGFAGTRGAVAEVDTFAHRRLFGVLWPMRSYEEVVHPLRLPAHDWFITGLDVNRGYGADALRAPDFEGAAAMPARPLG